MRCPKCGYISFDFNPACPKCTRDLTAEHEQLNLPSFRPDPPAILGALIGEANESSVGIHVDSGMDFETMEPHAAVGLEEAALGAEPITLGDSGELDISLNTEGEASLMGSEELEMAPEEIPSEAELEEAGIQDIALDKSEISLEQTGIPASMPGAESEPEEITLDLDDLTFEETDVSLEALSEDSQAGERELSSELEEFSLESPELTASPAPETPLPGIEDSAKDVVDSMAFELDEGLKEEADEIELSLEDLKIDDSGELQIGAQTAAESRIETSLDMGDISFDDLPTESESPGEPQAEGEDVTFDLDEFEFEADLVYEGSDERVPEETPLDFEDLDVELELEKPENKPPE